MGNILLDGHLNHDADAVELEFWVKKNRMSGTINIPWLLRRRPDP